MESKRLGNKSMSRSVVSLIVALEDEYGSIFKVPETDKTLQKIRKQLNKTIVAKPEVRLSMEWGYKINEKKSQKDVDFDSITTVCKQFGCKVNNATDGSTLFYYTSCNGKNPSSAMTQTCKKPYVVDVLELINIIRKDANNE